MACSGWWGGDRLVSPAAPEPGPAKGRGRAGRSARGMRSARRYGLREMLLPGLEKPSRPALASGTAPACFMFRPGPGMALWTFGAQWCFPGCVHLAEETSGPH